MDSLDKKQKILVMVSVMSALFFASINQTIVGTSLPKIIADIGGMEHFNWIFTIYMLTSSVAAILVGKLSDIYGRKPFILAGIVVFMIGSFLNGLSTDIIQLIAFRGIQGIGGGMLMSTAFTAVADIFPPRERGRWQGLMGAVFGLSSVFGPTLGGYIVDNFAWHWVFWVFIPLGFVAFILIAKLFPSTERKDVREKIDFIGSFFLVLTIVPLLLAFSFAGTNYDWISWQIMTLFSVALVGLVAFIIAEKKASDPIIPLSLFKNSVFTVSNAGSFFVGAGMFGALMYMPFFVQGVMGTSATASGFVTMPMTITMVIASAVGGQFITKTGKYKKMALAGLLIMAFGMYMLSRMGVETTNTEAVINMMILGFGLGLSFPVFTLTIQNAVERKQLGTATAASQLFRQLGGTIGVSILGTLMNARTADKMGELTSNLPNQEQIPEQLTSLQDPQLLMAPERVAQLSNSLPEQLKGVLVTILDNMKEALSYSLSHVFLLGMGIVLCGFVITLFLKELPLKETND